MSQISIQAVNASPIRSSMFARITSPPDHVPKELARYYVYWRIFYFLAATTHGIALIDFANRGVWFMMYFNIYSVTAFTCCLFLLRKGHYRTAYWIAVTELVGHAVAATLCVGPEFGALGATMLILILVFVQPFYSLRFSLSLAVLVLLIVAFTQNYALTHLPFYPDVTVSTFDRTLRVVSWPVLVLAMVIPFIRAAAQAEQELELAYGESERLLLNILPKSIATRLKSSDEMIADEHDRVAILFFDIVGFTEMSKHLQPSQLVSMLNEFFFAVDDLVEKHGVEKIKTIGDSYMIAAGAPEAMDRPEDRIADLALDIAASAKNLRRPDTGEKLEIRIGIHSGKVVAGVIGKQKFAYDMWGDTVNLASRMESTSVPGRIQVSDDFAKHLGKAFQLEQRGEIETKGRGRIVSHFLIGSNDFRTEKG